MSFQVLALFYMKEITDFSLELEYDFDQSKGCLSEYCEWPSLDFIQRSVRWEISVISHQEAEVHRVLTA